MADISQIKLPDGNTYDIKDVVARNALLNQFQYVICTAANNTPKDVSWTSGSNTITGTLVASDSTMYKIYLVPSIHGEIDTYEEYITINTVGTTYIWNLVGNTGADLSGLGQMAAADTATGACTPNGSINVMLDTTSKYVASSSTGGGSWQTNTPTEVTLPTFDMSVESGTELLTITWSGGSVTDGVAAQCTLPSFTSQTIATGVSSSSFTGSSTSVTVSPDI